MSLKVKIYSRMPAFVKQGMTRVYIKLRERRETLAAARMTPDGSSKARVVYVTGFPRSGTTMLKYYFSNYPGLKQSAFSPVGFFDAWKRSEGEAEILVDKSNHYIYSPGPLFGGCGIGARLLVIIRDPRDCLVSFAKYQENREVPRNGRYWSYWENQHSEIFRFAKESGFGDQIYFIRYEDLVEHPERAKAWYLNLLGFDVTPGELDRGYRNDHPDEGWHDSVHDYKQVGTHALQKWKQGGTIPRWCDELLPAWKDQREVVEMMRQLGYQEDGFSHIQLDSVGIHFFDPNSNFDSQPGSLSQRNPVPPPES